MMAVYTLTKRMAGSLIVISIGLMIASTKMDEAFICFWSISDCETKRLSPVFFLRRAARRRRMLGVLVSGSMTIMMMKIGPAAQRISQSDHRHPLAVTAKPESRGPSAGAANAAATHAMSA